MKKLSIIAAFCLSFCATSAFAQVSAAPAASNLDAALGVVDLDDLLAAELIASELEAGSCTVSCSSTSSGSSSSASCSSGSGDCVVGEDYIECNGNRLDCGGSGGGGGGGSAPNFCFARLVDFSQGFCVLSCVSANGDCVEGADFIACDGQVQTCG